MLHHVLYYWLIRIIKGKIISPLFPFLPSTGLACQVPIIEKNCKSPLHRKLCYMGHEKNNKPRSCHALSSSVHPNLLIWHQDPRPKVKTKHKLYPNSHRQINKADRWNSHACLFLLISYSCWNWLDSSVCWKKPSSMSSSNSNHIRKQKSYFLNDIYNLDVLKENKTRKHSLPDISNLMFLLGAEAPPQSLLAFLAACSFPSGTAWILSANAITSSQRDSRSSLVSPLTCIQCN